MILPFFVFVPVAAAVAAAAFCGLMIAIQAMGNFGFFNMLVVVLSLPLLDGRSIGCGQQPVTGVRGGDDRLLSWTLIAGLLTCRSTRSWRAAGPNGRHGRRCRADSAAPSAC